MTAQPVTVHHSVFLSWASADEQAKKDLLTLLVPNLTNLTGVTLDWWEMSHLRPGEAFKSEILARLDECDSGLQLISPAWAASPFIRAHESPVFVGPTARRMALPVGLRRVPLGGGVMDLHGVDALQVHLYKSRYFTELRGANRDAFAQTLALAIRDRILGTSPWRRMTRP